MTTLIGIVVVFFLGYASAKAKVDKHKNEGERLVTELLKNKFHGPEYHLIDDITLPTKEGTTQIDHVLVSRKGIFVIETKHYSGWIFGDEKSDRWTQTFNSRSKFSFQNPLHQNTLHINECIKTLGDLPEYLFRSLVVFTGDGVLKKGVSERVKYLEQLEPHIKGFALDVLSQDDVFNAVGKLEVYRKERSEQTDKEHVAYLKKKHNKEKPYTEVKVEANKGSVQFNWVDQKYTFITAGLIIVFVIGIFPSDEVELKGIKQTASVLPNPSVSPSKVNRNIQQLPNKIGSQTKHFIQAQQRKLAEINQRQILEKQRRAQDESHSVQSKGPFAEISYCDESGNNCTTKQYKFNK